MNIPVCTAGQARDFHVQGYLVLPDFVPRHQIDRLRTAARRIVNEFDIDAHRTVFSTRDRDQGRDAYFMASAERVHCFLEEGALDDEGQLTCPRHLAINKFGHAMHDHVRDFSQFCRQPQFSQALRSLGYRQPVLWQTMYIFKQPNIGGEVRWHQDASYLKTEPASVTGIWIALEDATVHNGCLWVQPRGHRSPLREIYEVDPNSGEGELRTLDETPWPDGHDAVALEVTAGTAVFFSDHMPHCSLPNQSGLSRHAFTMHVAEADAAWSPRNWLQRPNLGQFHL